MEDKRNTDEQNTTNDDRLGALRGIADDVADEDYDDAYDQAAERIEKALDPRDGMAGVCPEDDETREAYSELKLYEIDHEAVIAALFHTAGEVGDAREGTRRSDVMMAARRRMGELCDDEKESLVDPDDDEDVHPTDLSEGDRIVLNYGDEQATVTVDRVDHPADRHRVIYIHGCGDTGRMFYGGGEWDTAAEVRMTDTGEEEQDTQLMTDIDRIATYARNLAERHLDGKSEVEVTTSRGGEIAFTHVDRPDPSRVAEVVSRAISANVEHVDHPKDAYAILRVRGDVDVLVGYDAATMHDAPATPEAVAHGRDAQGRPRIRVAYLGDIIPVTVDGDRVVPPAGAPSRVESVARDYAVEHITGYQPGEGR